MDSLLQVLQYYTFLLYLGTEEKGEITALADFVPLGIDKGFCNIQKF